LIRRDEISKNPRTTKKGKAVGPTGIVSEMFMADEDCNCVMVDISVEFDSSSRENP